MAEHSPPDRLSALPVELVLKVLVKLPVKDLCRSRRLCKHIKNVIDANVHSLLQPTIAFHQRRLTSNCHTVLATTGMDFIPALSRFVGNYGPIDDESVGQEVLMSFCNLYTIQNYPTPSGGYHDKTVEMFFEVARLCVPSIRTYNGKDDDEGVQGQRKRDHIINFQLRHHTVIHHDPRFHSLVDARETVNISPAPNSESPGCECEPRYFLTSRYCSSSTGSYSEGVFNERPAWLDIPTLSVPRHRHFAYCMKSRALWRVVKWYKYWFNFTPPLFVIAAVLEELFIW